MHNACIKTTNKVKIMFRENDLLNVQLYTTQLKLKICPTAKQKMWGQHKWANHQIQPLAAERKHFYTRELEPNFHDSCSKESKRFQTGQCWGWYGGIEKEASSALDASEKATGRWLRGVGGSLRKSVAKWWDGERAVPPPCRQSVASGWCWLAPSRANLRC